MLSQRMVDIYGVVGVLVMAICLALVLFEAVPPSMYFVMFAVAFAIFAGRLVLRFLLARQNRRYEESEEIDFSSLEQKDEELRKKNSFDKE